MLGAFSGLFKPVSSLPRLSGPVLVVGSGPGACLPAGYDDTWTLATVNGSQIIAARLGCGSPDLTLLGLSVLQKAPVNREAQAVLRDGSTGVLICINGRRRYSLARMRLARLGYRFNRFCYLTREARLAMTSDVLGARINSQLKPSNGVTLAFLCLNLGASLVVMTGFSLSKSGHAYNDQNRPRLHANEDAALLKRSIEKGIPIYTSQSDFAEESGLPLYDKSIDFAA